MIFAKLCSERLIDPAPGTEFPRSVFGFLRSLPKLLELEYSQFEAWALVLKSKLNSEMYVYHFS